MLDWSKYIEIAEKFQYRARKQDKDDLRHNIILSLAVAQRTKCNGHERLSTKAMFRIAKYECQKYWRQIKRGKRIISLNTIISDGDGHATELSEVIKDDKSIDMDSCLSAKMELGTYPKRLLAIGNKILLGKALLNEEHQYLWRFRRKKAIHFQGPSIGSRESLL